MGTTEYRIDRDIVIDAPVEVVWRTITEPDQISQWFADKVDLEVKPGARGYLGFGQQGGPVLVETVEPPTRWSFRWNHPAGEEPAFMMIGRVAPNGFGNARTFLRVIKRPSTSKSSVPVQADLTVSSHSWAKS